ncbi:MAG: Fic family protein [Thermoplasmata archaeon]
MSSLTRKYINSIKFSSDHVATLRMIGEYKGKQELFGKRSPEALKTMRSLAIIESTESSNRLEGITAERGRVRGIMLGSATPESRPEQGIAGYRDALARIHESWEGLEFDTALIKRLHEIINSYMPESGGRWKTKDNLIIQKWYDEKSGLEQDRVRFRPTSAKETPKAMERLVKQYADAADDSHDPLVIIPLAVLDFLCVHPFRNGNGRVARLITLLLLYRAGYQVGRYISLERIFEESKESYYNTLETSSAGWHDDKHNPLPWLTYFWGVLIRAYREFEGRVGTVTTRWGAKTEQIELTIERQAGEFSISNIESACPGISRVMIRNVMRRLRDEKKIKPVGAGKGRGARWMKQKQQQTKPASQS